MTMKRQQSAKERVIANRLLIPQLKTSGDIMRFTGKIGCNTHLKFPNAVAAIRQLGGPYFYSVRRAELESEIDRPASRRGPSPAAPEQLD